MINHNSERAGEDVTATERDSNWPQRPSYEQLKAAIAQLRSDLDWAIGLLREIRHEAPPSWWEGLTEFLDAIDAEEATDD